MAEVILDAHRRGRLAISIARTDKEEEEASGGRNAGVFFAAPLGAAFPLFGKRGKIVHILVDNFYKQAVCSPLVIKRPSFRRKTVFLYPF